MAFSDFTAPSVAGQALKRQLAPVLMKNIVQEMIQSNGKGVTEEFSMDTNALEIRVVREKPLTQTARSIGEAVDGGYFSAQTAEQPTSAEYGIRVNLGYDISDIRIFPVSYSAVPWNVYELESGRDPKTLVSNLQCISVDIVLQYQYTYSDKCKDFSICRN